MWCSVSGQVVSEVSKECHNFMFNNHAIYVVCFTVSTNCSVYSHFFM